MAKKTYTKKSSIKLLDYLEKNDLIISIKFLRNVDQHYVELKNMKLEKLSWIFRNNHPSDHIYLRSYCVDGGDTKKFLYKMKKESYSFNAYYYIDIDDKEMNYSPPIAKVENNLKN
jgi:hypothetical protein